MITIRPVTTTSDYLLTPIIALYEKAFPAYERRDTIKFIHLIAHENRFSCLAIMKDDEFVGFFTKWDLGSFCYGEHFAVDDKFRGQNIGSESLKMILSEINKPIILEVEKPTDDFSTRRINFYKRAHFTLCTEHYLQPPYEKDFEPIPMYLMEYGGTLTQTQFSTIVKKLQTEIYGIKIA